MVPAMAATMPNGANFITRLVNLNITSDSDSQKRSIGSFAAPRTWASAMAKSTEKNTTCSTSFLAAASKKLAGTVCSSTPPRVVGVLANCFPSSEDVPRTTPTPGCARFTAQEADHQRHGGDDLEIDQGLEREPADPLQVVAVARDADHEAGEDERHDDGLDHPEEDRRERLQRLTHVHRGPDRVVEVADHGTQDRGDDDPLGEGRPAEEGPHRGVSPVEGA